jgi:predicted 2-oxoglutarate/Fe(II)-dependent dioxygenase YbiX
MAIFIKENFITWEQCIEIRDFLDPRVKETPLFGILGALGFPTSAEAASVNEESGLLRGVEDPANYRIGALYTKIKKEAEQHLNQELDLCQSNYQLMTKGSRNPLHADNFTLKGKSRQKDGSPEESEWSGLLYLSTHGEEFHGGTLFFPEFEYSYTPKAGDLVIFKGDVEHRHEVLEVTSGERRNITFFWGRKGNISDRSFYSDR